jgi:hypothetical protein
MNAGRSTSSPISSSTGPSHVGSRPNEAFGVGVSSGDLRLDGIEEADELLMPTALHIAADIERG